MFSAIWLGIIRVKYHSFDTDMGIQMMQKESQQKNRNFVFAVHITDLIPIYAFSDSVDIEQVTKCLKKVSVQFLLNDTN